MKEKRAVGQKAERLAAAYLRSLGMEILANNYRIRQGEIDLIGKDGDTLVFVEVKARENEKNGYPGEALSREKIRRICRTARVYCYREGISSMVQIRFDVVEIMGSRIRHTKNAFEYCL